jgi:hypothetical protein
VDARKLFAEMEAKMRSPRPAFIHAIKTIRSKGLKVCRLDRYLFPFASFKAHSPLN